LRHEGIMLRHHFLQFGDFPTNRVIRVIQLLILVIRSAVILEGKVLEDYTIVRRIVCVIWMGSDRPSIPMRIDVIEGKSTPSARELFVPPNLR
jgi:hypothetical protein